MPAKAQAEDHRWFASSDRGIPESRFDDVTIEIDLGQDFSEREDDATVANVEDLPPIIPRPAKRVSTPLPTGNHQSSHRDARFAELKVIIREMRVVLMHNWNMLEAELDAVEWQLRERVARL